jgi:hypothetical protein
MQLIDAIWDDDPDTIRQLVTAIRTCFTSMPHRQPQLGTADELCANVGRDRLIRLLYDLGARDLETAMDRAVLQSRVSTAAMLHEMMGRPTPPDDAFGGSAYTLSAAGTEFLFRVGGRVRFDDGSQSAPVETAIGSDSRNPEAKRRILALYAEHGYVYPDHGHHGVITAARFDLLEFHLARDPGLLHRRFAIEEIFPPESVAGTCPTRPWVPRWTEGRCSTWRSTGTSWTWPSGCWTKAPRRTRVLRLMPTASAGIRRSSTRWFPGRILDETIRKAGTLRPEDARFTELLLARGADPNTRTSIRMRLGEGHGDPRIREFKDVNSALLGAAVLCRHAAGEQT